MISHKLTIAVLCFVLGCLYVGSVSYYGRLQFEAGQRSVADDANETGSFRVKGTAFTNCERVDGAAKRDRLAQGAR